MQGTLYLAFNMESAGHYTLGGGTLTVGGGYEWIGFLGTATFTQTGGMHAVSGSLNLGAYSDGSGSYTLGGGTLAVGAPGSTDFESIGFYGPGAFTQTGGTHTVTGCLALAMLSGYSGTYTLGSGALTVGTSASAGSENLGVEGTGTFTQSGGTHTVYGTLDLGDNSGSKGAYTLSGGTLGLTGSENIGVAGHGTFTQSSGTHSVVGNMTLGTSGSYHMYGGSLNVTGTIGGPGTVIYQGGWLNADTIAAGLNIAAGATLTKTGAGVMTISGPQSHGAGAALVVSSGTVNLNSSGGDNEHRFLSVTVGGGAVLNVGATQYLSSLTMTNSARASINAVGTAGPEPDDQDQCPLD